MNPETAYVCLVCKNITDYWKPGGVCEGCETEAERQMDEKH